MPRHAATPSVWYSRLIAAVSCLFFAQLYVTSRPSYLRLPDYAAGTERLPFQARDLMRWPLAWAGRSATLHRLTAGHTLLNSPELLVVEVAAFVSLLLAGWATVKLYHEVYPEAGLPLLPWALLVVLCIFDFALTVPFSFPYDLPATMFLGWGTYFVLTRRFALLLPLFVVATFNRETTLFLILILLLNGMTRDGRTHWRLLQARDLLQAALLAILWLGIELLQHHRYAHNSSEAGPRIAGNLHALANPLLWPNILSASAFLLPWIFIERRRIPDPRLRACLLVLPLWVLLLLSVGQVLEVRIYGDISVLVAVAAAVLVERHIAAADPAEEASVAP